MPAKISSRLGYAFGAAFVLLGAIVFMTYLSTQRLIETNSAGNLARTAHLAVTALALVGLIVLGSFFLMLRRYVRQRQKAMADLRQERAKLEEGVRERTAALENELRERHRAERKQKTSEAQYRTLVEQVKDYAIFRLDPDGGATSWNEGVKRVLGYDEEEFIGLGTEAIFTPEDIQAGTPWQELEYAAAHGSANNDRWMIRKDGAPFFAAGITTALHDENGDLIGFSKVMRDQTTRKQTEDALRESETRYRLVALASREAIWDLNLTSNSLTWNERIESLFGYTLDEIEPTMEWWRDRIHPDERERVVESRETAIERGEEFWSADYRFRRADGQYAMVTDRGVIARDEDQAVRMLGTIADVTERRRTDEKLSQAQRMEAVGRLAGGIAHDLNNMLTAIVGYSTFVERALDPEDPRRSDVAEIQKAAERSAGLTRSLLAFARREMIQPQALDLNRIVLAMGRMLRPAMGESINVEIALEPIEGTVHADRGRLEQVILNIALNARDAMPAGGRLSIATRSVELDQEDAKRHPGTEITPGRFVQLSITDTGHGMDAQTLARVFEPFYTTKGVGEGTGLGLSTVYGTVKQAGGFVWAYSEPGHGTAFTVYLPVTLNPALQTGATTSGEHKTPGGTETILVVEDEEMVRCLAQRALEAEGYHCITAANGADALVILEQLEHPVDLVVADIVMPGMSGRDLGRAITQRFPSARILFTSGFSDDEVIRRGLMESGQPFLQKPWSADRLLRRARELLDERMDRTGWERVSETAEPPSDARTSSPSKGAS